MARQYHVIDGDAHTRYGKDYFEKWLPKKYQDRAPKLVKDPLGGDAWQYGPDVAPYPIALTSLAGVPYDEFKHSGVRYEDIRPGTYDGAGRLKDMDQDGVDAEILFSDNTTMSFFMNLNDKDYQLAGIHGYNNYLVEEFCAPDPARLIGLAQIPNAGIEASVAELNRAKKLGMHGIHIRAWPASKPAISPDDDPFWAAAEEMGMPVANHGFALAPAQQRAGVVQDRGGPIHALSSKTLGTGEGVTRFIVQMIATGVFDRFPKLKVGLIETQACWIPGFLENMNDNYFRNKVWGHVNLKRTPSEYWQSNFYVTFIIDQFGIKNRHDIGVETMQWSSDYPHHGNDWPQSQKVIQYQFAGVPEDEKRKMVCDNAVRTYGLA